MHMMRLRLISMKLKIKTLLGHTFRKLSTVALIWPGEISFLLFRVFLTNLGWTVRSNSGVDKSEMMPKDEKKSSNSWPKLYVSKKGLSQTIAFDSIDHKINSLWIPRVYMCIYTHAILTLWGYLMFGHDLTRSIILGSTTRESLPIFHERFSTPISLLNTNILLQGRWFIENHLQPVDVAER